MKPILNYVRDRFFCKRTVSYLRDLSTMVTLRDTLNKTKKALEVATSDFMEFSATDTYISLADLGDLLHMGKLELKDILSHTKHISELTAANTNTIDVYAVVDKEHVTLCANPDECAQHKDKIYEKIQIVTIR